MKAERTKNAARNVVFGIILKLYTMLISFGMRTAMIYWLGVEYLGLNGLFVSILEVLNLAELGVGSAMTFAMYKPLAQEDNGKICALLKLYRFYYRIIGSVILAVGILIVPFIPRLIIGTVPKDINLYVLYLLNLGATVLSYWLFAYRNSIFTACQRNDVVSKVTFVTDTIRCVIQLLVLALFHNYYYFAITILVTQILNNILVAYMSQKMYPQFKPVGILDPEERRIINRSVRDLFTSKLGGTIVGSADTIVISAFIGLRALAVYQNYAYILSALSGIIMILFKSVLAGTGNSMVTESEEKNYHDLKKLSWITYWIIGFGICGLCCLYQPLMKIWVGSTLMLDYSFVILFCLYFFGNMTIQLLSIYKNAAGIWHKDRFRPLIAGLADLGLNLIMVQFIGLYGILLSTIISIFFVSLPWLLHNVFTLIFPGRLRNYLKGLAAYIGVIIVVTCVTAGICSLVPDGGISWLLVKAVACTVICNGLFAAVYCRTGMFKEVLHMAGRVLNG